MYMKEHYLLVKAEETPYTAETPTGSNAVEAFDISITPYTGPTLSRENTARAMHGAAEEIMLETWVNISFSVYMSASGTEGVAPAYGPLLAACFASETVVADTSVTYAPAATNAPVTMFYDIGNGSNTQRHSIIGCGGTFILTENANQKGVYNFTMVGFYTRPATATEITPSLASFLTGLTFDDDNTDTFSIHTFTTGQILSYSLDAGVEVKPRNLPGRKAIDFAGRSSKGALSLLAPDLATKNFFTSVESHNGATTGALSVVRGDTAGNIISISAPKVQLTNPRLGEDSGKVKLDMDMLYIPSTGDDEWSIAYT